MKRKEMGIIGRSIFIEGIEFNMMKNLKFSTSSALKTADTNVKQS